MTNLGTQSTKVHERLEVRHLSIACSRASFLLSLEVFGF
jgi:hypothetical protein